MTHRKSVRLLAVAGLFLVNSIVPLQADSVSTGDLGYNVVTLGGAYSWSPTIPAPSATLAATLEVVHGLWNDPGVTVHAYVNGTEVGTFLSDVGYIFPGPSSNSFNITGLLVDGVNTIVFNGLGQSAGDYIIGGITVNYNLPAPTNNPPPVTNALPSLPGLLHYLTRTPLETVPGSQVTGAVRLQWNEQEKASLQKFDLEAKGLEPSTDYFLVATTDEEAKVIQRVKSDGKGRLSISYMAKGQGEGGGKKAFPSGLAPLTEIRAMSLQKGPDVIAAAIISTSPEFEYLVKRRLTQADTNSTAMGVISLKANANEVNFRLRAKGLSAGQTYQLALNAVVVQTVSADALGQVTIEGWPASAPAILDLRTLSLLDASNAVVLGTALPK
jgi:hypothetical protein